jgi:hypothetical protein
LNILYLDHPPPIIGIPLPPPGLLSTKKIKHKNHYINQIRFNPCILEEAVPGAGGRYCPLFEFVVEEVVASATADGYNNILEIYKGKILYIDQCIEKQVDQIQCRPKHFKLLPFKI